MTDKAAFGDASPRASIVELAAEVVASYVARHAVPPVEMPALIETVHGALSGLGKPSAPAAEREKPTPAVSVRKSITDDHLISLEDGKPYKALKRHLRKLGMTPDSYREKWGLPGNYPMVSPAYSRARSTLAKELGLGSMRRAR